MNCVCLWCIPLVILCLVRDARPRPSPITDAQNAQPVTPQLDTDQPEERQKERGRSPLARKMRSGRRLRMLEKVLRRLSHNDIMALIRNKKGGRGSYDFYDPYAPTRSSRPRMPNVECPLAPDGVPLVACPSRDMFGEYVCIDEYALCDNKVQCPNGEDEDGTVCMFHKVRTWCGKKGWLCGELEAIHVKLVDYAGQEKTMNNFRILTDAILGMEV